MPRIELSAPDLEKKVDNFDLLTNFGFLISILLFFINPLGAIIICLSVILYTNSKDEKLFYLLFTLIALFLGLINTTKFPESDLAKYQAFFYDAKNYSFNDYLLRTRKEPVYTIINYLLFKILNGSFPLYIFLITFLCYELYLLSIYKFLIKHYANAITIVFSIIIASFFYQNFQSSGHLVRQFMASSILFYFMVNKFFYNRNQWPLVIISVLLHSSSLLFLPLLFIKSINKKITLPSLVNYKVIIFILAIMGLFIAMPLLFNILSKIPFLSYILFRIDSMNFNDTDSGELSLIGLSILLMLFVITFMSIYIRRIKLSSGLYHLLNIFMFLSIFVLFFLKIPLISLRFFFYIYFFIPFIIFLLPQNTLFNSIRLVGSGFLIILFFYGIKNSTWSYETINNLILNPVFSYLK